jgi:hypothetical protein
VTLFAHSLKNNKSKYVPPWVYIFIEIFWRKNDYLSGPRGLYLKKMKNGL